jgi:nucleoid-associated protein YgaU
MPGRPALATQPDNSGQDKAAGQPVRLDQPVMGPANQIVKEPSSPANAQSVNEDSSRGTRAPLGTPLPAVSPIVAPALPPSAASSASPQVESYDEDTYTCKANDTFRSISQAVYRTDAYDQALLLFNRNHPLANEAIKQNPPLLQAGQPIYIPPLQILRKYYAASIPDNNNLTGVRNPASNETPSATQPLTLMPPASGAVTATGAAPATGTATTTASTRTYRVGGTGEMIRDIARRTLGNGDRWTEIYHLNRSYDPMYAVPAGTELRLPADARVDTQ